MKDRQRELAEIAEHNGQYLIKASRSPNAALLLAPFVLSQRYTKSRTSTMTSWISRQHSDGRHLTLLGTASRDYEGVLPRGANRLYRTEGADTESLSASSASPQSQGREEA